MIDSRCAVCGSAWKRIRVHLGEQLGMSRFQIRYLVFLGIIIFVVVFLSVIQPQIEQANQARATESARANTITITVNYGTEKRRWLEDVVPRFEQAYPNIVVQLIGQGSMGSYRDLSQLKDSSRFMPDGRTAIPTLWSPASSIQVNLLNQETNSTTTLNRNLAVDCQPLFLSPVAIMGWESRFQAFERTYPDGVTFANLEDALTGPAQGRWGELGGDANWGLLKIGYTNPHESNSGMMMLITLANDYYKRAAPVTAADVTAAGFVANLAALTNAVSQPLISSSGDLMNAFIARGPASYDFVIVYEALAIEHYANAIGRQQQALRIVYPRYNLTADNPQCLVDHPASTPAQREAARLFQAYLLTPDIQRLALTYGYRPADLSIPLFGANTPFDDADLKAAGLASGSWQDISLPDGATINTLLQVWRRSYTGS